MGTSTRQKRSFVQVWLMYDILAFIPTERKMVVIPQAYAQLNLDKASKLQLVPMVLVVQGSC